MERIFQNKKLSILIVAAILVVVVLVCMLLVTLIQMSSLNRQTDQLNQLIQAAEQDSAKMQELLDFINSNEYVRQWAEENGRLSPEDIVWLEQNAPKN